MEEEQVEKVLNEPMATRDGIWVRTLIKSRIENFLNNDSHLNIFAAKRNRLGVGIILIMK